MILSLSLFLLPRARGWLGSSKLSPSCHQPSNTAFPWRPRPEYYASVALCPWSDHNHWSNPSSSALFMAKTAKKRLDKNKRRRGPTKKNRSLLSDKNVVDARRPTLGKEYSDGLRDDDDDDDAVAARERQQKEQQYQAEQVMRQTAQQRGATIQDVTWYPTQVVVILDDQAVAVVADHEDDGAREMDDNNDIVIVGESLDDEDTSENVDSDENVDAGAVDEESTEDCDPQKLDSHSLSTIAAALLEALEEPNDQDPSQDVGILSRHELIVTTPGASNVLETDRQFRAYRGFDVLVELYPPKDNNNNKKTTRTRLEGKLVDRTLEDVILNQRGRKVALPLSTVKSVRLPPAKREKGVPRDAPF